MVAASLLMLVGLAKSTPSPAAQGSVCVLSIRVTRHGKPVEGADVTVESHERALTGWSARTLRATTATDGRCLVSVGPGYVNVSAVGPSKGELLYSKKITQKAVSASPEPFRLSLDLVPPVVVKGVAYMEDTLEPVQGEAVDIEATGGVRQVTDSKGEFQFSVAPGDVRVILNRVQGHDVNVYAIEYNVDGKHNPFVRLAVPRSSVMEPIHHLEGDVKDEAGEPVPGAQVWIWESYRSTVADESGHYRFEVDTRPGSHLYAYSMRAASRHGAKIWKSATEDLVISASPTTVTGRVVDVRGKPVAGTTVRICAKAISECLIRTIARVKTASDGTYSCVLPLPERFQSGYVETEVQARGRIESEDFQISVGRRHRVKDIVLPD